MRSGQRRAAGRQRSACRSPVRPGEVRDLQHALELRHLLAIAPASIGFKKRENFRDYVMRHQYIPVLAGDGDGNPAGLSPFCSVSGLDQFCDQSASSGAASGMKGGDMAGTDRRNFLKGQRPLRARMAMLPGLIERAMAIPAHQCHGHHRGCRAYRRLHAGEPLVRSLFRHAERCARFRRSAPGAPPGRAGDLGAAERRAS